jgi:serine protease
VSGDIGTVYILMFDPATNSVVAEDVTDADQDYRFNFVAVPQGSYEVWAGTDNDNDFFICDEGEACGAWQTVDAPVLLNVDTDISNLEMSTDYLIALPATGSASVGSNSNSSRAGLLDTKSEAAVSSKKRS